MSIMARILERSEPNNPLVAHLTRPCIKMRKVPKGDYESVCTLFVKQLWECIEEHTEPKKKPIVNESGLKPIVKSRREMY
jgi:hypothetical protein